MSIKLSMENIPLNDHPVSGIVVDNICNVFYTMFHNTFQINLRGSQFP